MAVQTMMKNKILFLFFLFISSFAFSETLSNKWVIAAEQFEVNQINQNDKFLEGISKTIPQLILEKLDANIVRNIYPDEKFERKQVFIDQECILRMAPETPRRTGVLIKSAMLGSVI